MSTLVFTFLDKVSCEFNEISFLNMEVNFDRKPASPAPAPYFCSTFSLIVFYTGSRSKSLLKHPSSYSSSSDETIASFRSSLFWNISNFLLDTYTELDPSFIFLYLL